MLAGQVQDRPARHQDRQPLQGSQQIGDDWRMEAQIPVAIALLPAKEDVAPEPTPQPQGA